MAAGPAPSVLTPEWDTGTHKGWAAAGAETPALLKGQPQEVVLLKGNKSGGLTPRTRGTGFINC